MAALRFDHVTKTFAHHTGRMLLRDRLMILLRRSTQGRLVALNDVCFELAPGESLGLIGGNGAGKSTCLNLATGVVLPDSGSIEVHGRVAAILELGGGFHRDLTGAENLLINAALMGLTRRQTAERYEQIVEFSGVRDFIDDPLRTYSDGMVVRLAFSVAVHTDPDILVIDEVIGMGDQVFYARSLDKLKEFQRQGKTMVMASHSMDLLLMFCQHAMWLDHGHVVRHGPAKEVVEAYKASRDTPEPPSKPRPKSSW
jgi:ABC-type polysaccharide/polyol phosphate transport system ATPase subunit